VAWHVSPTHHVPPAMLADNCTAKGCFTMLEPAWRRPNGKRRFAASGWVTHHARPLTGRQLEGKIAVALVNDRF